MPNIIKPVTHGTGIHKRDAERAQRKIIRQEQEYFKSPEHALATIKAKREIEEAAKHAAEILDIKTPASLEYDEYQQAAIDGAKIHKHFCIIGAAGTGKTTVLKAVINSIESTLREITFEQTGQRIKKNGNGMSDENENVGHAKVYSVAFCAFTGRAVQQIKRALPEKYRKTCMTAHKMLGYAPVLEDYFDKKKNEWTERKVFRPSFNAAHKLPYDVIVIDEASMLSVRLFNEIMEAKQPGTRILFSGDINQLPPVMDRSVLPFAMMELPTFELKQIHRQAADNPIIANAHRILNGQMPIADKKNIFLISLSDDSTKASAQMLAYVKALSQHGKFNHITDAFIVPTNVGTLGQEYLNSDLMNFFNAPKKQDDGTILNRRFAIKAARSTELLAIGDKIMLLQNDNDLGLTNGMIGVITDITLNGLFRDDKLGFLRVNHDDINAEDISKLLNGDFAENEADDEISTKDDKPSEDENQRQASHITTVKFGTVDGDVEIKLQTVGHYGKIAHAWAFTCHKAQGGEYPTIVVGFHSAVARMLTREWLYTAFTRARENVYILCNARGLQMALRNQTIKGTNVHEKARAFLAQMQSKDMTKPNLPKPEILS